VDTFSGKQIARTTRFDIIGRDAAGYYLCLTSVAGGPFGPCLGWGCGSYSELESLIGEVIADLRDLLIQVNQSPGVGTLSPRYSSLPIGDRSGALSLRFAILKRDRYRCQVCGRSAQDGTTLEVDHRIPRAKGGTNDPANLWTLCYECNRGKGDTAL
jgi:HNH endonuclease